MGKFWIHVELVYQVYNLIFSWFALVHPSPSLSFPSPLTHGIFGIEGNFYITFITRSDSIEDPLFKLVPVVHIVNVILEYFYLGLL